MISAEVYIKSTPPYFFGGTEEPIEQEDLLEFRLLYSGPVHASSNKNTHTTEKHAIRRVFHPQLRRLWNLHNGLRQLAVNAGNESDPRPSATEQERIAAGIAAIGKTWNRIGFDFVPLVTEKHTLRCALDITLLRPEEDKYIYRAGDIDGQLKTIFDALRLPVNGEANNVGPQDDETPLYCLLEDDRLISDVRVNADQLLMLPGHREAKATDAFVIIHVRLNYKTGRTFDRYFD